MPRKPEIISGPCCAAQPGQALLEGRLKIYEYSNVVLTARLRAGAMGASFVPVRSLGGTDNFAYSGAKLIEDPYTGQPTVIVPALNPDVALIHVQQADVYGNARIFGAGITDVESALASKKVIVSAEDIVDTEDIRHNPGLTKIPYYVVDAGVHAPFGAFPGECPGVYASDTEHVGEVFLSMQFGQLGPYLEKWVYSVSLHAIAEDGMGRPVGCGRLLPDGHVGRMAVIAAWRGKGVGSALLDHLVALARARGDAKAMLNVETHALPFYERHGFAAVGEPFDEAGIPHRAMERYLR